jgi:hypothetical protein
MIERGGKSTTFLFTDNTLIDFFDCESWRFPAGMEKLSSGNRCGGWCLVQPALPAAALLITTHLFHSLKGISSPFNFFPNFAAKI